MRFLGALFGRVTDWAMLGGFGRFVYKTLATGFAILTVGEFWANGFSQMAGIYAFLTIGMFIVLYNDD